MLLIAYVLAGIGGLLMAGALTHVQVVVAVTMNRPGHRPDVADADHLDHGASQFSSARAGGGVFRGHLRRRIYQPLVVLGMTGGVVTALPMRSAIVGGVQLLVAVFCLAVPRLGGLLPHANVCCRWHRPSATEM